jgi:hypothetical protein
MMSQRRQASCLEEVEIPDVRDTPLTVVPSSAFFQLAVGDEIGQKKSGAKVIPSKSALADGSIWMISKVSPIILRVFQNLAL